MDANLQRRVQRYGWDRAAQAYEPLWEEQLAPARQALLSAIALTRGQAVLDVACGTGLVALEAARAVGRGGRVLGTDLSGEMVLAARRRAAACRFEHAQFERMDAECLAVPDDSFDAASCALGLMYVAEPLRAVREICRTVRPGGRVGLAVWGERERCGWAPVFTIIQQEVSTEVCPLFFSLGRRDALADLSRTAGLELLRETRIETLLAYRDAGHACDSAFVGGPVALAWARFDASTRARVRQRYLQAIEPWRCGAAFRIPAEFLLVSARVPVARLA